MTDNSVILSGIIAAKPCLSHFSHGVKFFGATLITQRLSGAYDKLPVIIPDYQGLAPPQNLQPGDAVTIHGQLRSYNNKSGVGARLVISVLAREVTLCGGGSDNTVKLSGLVCKPPVLRRTPFGREICDLLVCVPRTYGRSDYLPCIAWGGTARAMSLLSAGEPVQLTGRLQSRPYTKQYEDGHEEEKTAYEISITQAKKTQIL